MVDKIEQGIDGTDLKAGIIAEIGSSQRKITPLEEKVFIAAALAHNHADAQSPRYFVQHDGAGATGVATSPRGRIFRVTVGHCDLKTTSTTF